MAAPKIAAAGKCYRDEIMEYEKAWIDYDHNKPLSILFEEHKLDVYVSMCGLDWHPLRGGWNECFMSVRTYDITNEPITPIYRCDLERLSKLSSFVRGHVGKGGFCDSKHRKIKKRIAKMEHARNLHVLGTTISNKITVPMSLLQRATEIYSEFQLKYDSIYGDNVLADDSRFYFPFDNVAVLKLTDLVDAEYSLQLLKSRVLGSEIVQQLYSTIEDHGAVEVLSVYMLSITGMTKDYAKRVRYTVHTDRISNEGLTMIIPTMQPHCSFPANISRNILKYF